MVKSALKYNVPCAAILLVFIMSIMPIYADSLLTTTNACLPEVNFIYDNTAQSFCLNRLNPDTDSCIHFSITLKKNYNITSHFSRSLEQIWTFDSITHGNKSLIDNTVRINIINDENGTLSGVQISAGRFLDTTSMNLMLKKQFDIPENKPDSLNSMTDFVFSKSSFLCANELKKAVVVNREFVYPGNYMRRGQYLNYPELKMFHCGGNGPKVPNAISILHRTVLQNYYHVLTLPPFEYEEAPEHKRWVPPSKVKKDKKNFLKFRPID